MKIVLLLLIFTGFTFSSKTQNLYWPRDVKKAYKNETRSNDGWPAKNTGKTRPAIRLQ